tara:strand:- start:1557 stop:2267 length:711 start_codon:yes stop_codon:yes gene_type:complete
MTDLISDIINEKGDCHLHTNWTDGKDSIEEMIIAACNSDLNWIIFSEHNRSTSVYSYIDFKKSIEEFKSIYSDIQLISGAECKILDYSGSIDISKEALENAQIITGVVHRFPGEKGNIINQSSICFAEEDKLNALQLEKELSICGIRKGDFHILGHPLGMTIRRFGHLPKLSDFNELIIECKKHHIVFELNLRYHLPLIKSLKEILIANGVQWTIGSNSHSSIELQNLWLKYHKLL